MHRYCVLTNDLQHDLVTKNSQRSANVSRMAPVLVSFLEVMRAAGVPVVHLQLVYDETDQKIERHGGRIPVLRGTPGAEILPEFLRPGDVVLEKKKDSGFFETGLESLLREREVDTVIITGMQAQVCVQTTAADAHFRGFNVIVPSDGVVSTREEDRQRALEWLAAYCAVVVPLAEVLRRLEAREAFDFTPPALP